jgi:uncharacterized protein (DUF433 family)
MLGLGVYTLREAALYGGVSSNKLSRWAFGAGSYPSVFDSQLQGHRLISFYDLIQGMAIDRARAKGIRLSKIRQAIERARDEFGIPCPLAYRHVLYFDGELLIDLPDRRIVGLTGAAHNQAMMRPIVEPFKEHLCFAGDGRAERYTPFEKYGRKIILNPKRQFGQPLVDTTGYRADVLANAYRVEGTIEAVMEEFNIEREDVNIAVDYMNSLGTAA